MKGTENLELLGEINEEYIASAENMKKRNSAWRIALPIAAGFCLVLGAGLILGKVLGRRPNTGNDITAMVTQTPAADTPNTDEPISEEPKDSEGPEVGERWDGVDIALAYRRSGEESSDSTIKLGFSHEMFIYHGRPYHYFTRADIFSDIFGEKIAHVERFEFIQSRINDEGSPYVFEPVVINTSDYELYGSFEGNVFTLKGFDPEDVLCQRGFNGEIEIYISDKALTEGGCMGFWENVLHITDMIDSVEYSYRIGSGENTVVKRMQLVKDGYSDEIDELIDMLDNGEWTEDGREAYQYYSDDPMPDRYIDVDLKNGITFCLMLYRDGIIRLTNPLGDRAVKTDAIKMNAFLDKLENRIGIVMDTGTNYQLNKLRSDARYGYLVPDYIPEGFELTAIAVYYDVDYDTGEILGTSWMTIHIKNFDTDEIVKMWMYPRSQLEYEAKGMLNKGGHIAKLEDFTIEDVFVKDEIEPNGERYIESDVAIDCGDECIYLWGPNTEPATVYDIISSIMN